MHLESLSIQCTRSHLSEATWKFAIAIDSYSKSYGNIVLIGDFNAMNSDSHMDSFCAICHLKSLIKEPTYYKKTDKPTRIDLILTNSPR